MDLAGLLVYRVPAVLIWILPLPVSISLPLAVRTVSWCVVSEHLACLQPKEEGNVRVDSGNSNHNRESRRVTADGREVRKFSSPLVTDCVCLSARIRSRKTVLPDVFSGKMSVVALLFQTYRFLSWPCRVYFEAFP